MQDEQFLHEDTEVGQSQADGNLRAHHHWQHCCYYRYPPVTENNGQVAIQTVFAWHVADGAAATAARACNHKVKVKPISAWWCVLATSHCNIGNGAMLAASLSYVYLVLPMAASAETTATDSAAATTASALSCHELAHWERRHCHHRCRVAAQSGRSSRYGSALRFSDRV